MTDILHINKIGKIPIYEISADYYFLPSLDNSLIIDEILSTANNSDNRWSNDRNNKGPMFEDVFFTPGKETNNLLTCVNSIAEVIGCESIHEFWAQVHKQGESTNLHHHATFNDFVFVYYVQVPPKSGVLYFELETIGRSIIQPIEHMCVIFPSYLKHGVTKNLDDNLRISVSGNLKKKK